MEEDPQEDPREQLSDLQDLVRSRGWVRLSSIAEAQVKTRTNNALKPLDQNSTPYQAEFLKGEIAGIRLFMQLPQIAIEALRQQQKEQEDASDDDSETDRPAV